VQSKKTLDVLRRRVLSYGHYCAALTIVIASLMLASGAASSQPGAEPDAAGGYEVLHLFTWAQYPTGKLIFDAAGNLYGTTVYGGSRKCPGGCGVVYKLAHNPKGGWTVGILHAFTGADGVNPLGGVILDATGNLYGTTLNGGANNRGTVFKLAPNPDGTWTENVLYSFKGAGDGSAPVAGLIFDATGNLYGTTQGGGGCGVFCGVVFKLAPNTTGTWTESVLSTLGGFSPSAELIADGTGNLYGTAAGFGLSGIVFKLAPNPDGTWTESELYSFTGGPEGGFPLAGLIFDAVGNLYSTTGAGGAYGYGVVFKLAPNPDGTWTESVLYSFTGGADGRQPEADLVFHAGNLYGTTTFGGDLSACSDGGCGVVFKLAPTSTGWRETVLHTFIGFGAEPVAPVIFDPAGNLYGTTIGGNGNSGLVFEITR
jgi:uncharacterized repeat protein (TIGR03803 family)